MDVIEAHARRLPPLDDRWLPRPYERDELERALLAGDVAGTATHPLDNVRGNILMLIDGDPDKLFGLSGLPDGYGLDAILDLVAIGAGRPIDHEARYGPVDIAPGPILDACRAMGERLAGAARAGETRAARHGPPRGPRAPLPRARGLARGARRAPGDPRGGVQVARGSPRPRLGRRVLRRRGRALRRPRAAPHAQPGGDGADPRGRPPRSRGGRPRVRGGGDRGRRRDALASPT